MTTTSEAATEILVDRIGSEPINAMIVVGLGLGLGIESMLTDAIAVPYDELPGFPQDAGGGRLIVGQVDEKRIACCIGRAPHYATGDVRGMAAAFETLAMLGATKALLTGSVTSVNADIAPGSLVLINDHINLTGVSPLVGLGGADDFISLVDAYDQRLARRLKRVATLAGVPLRDGVYMMFVGSSFETPAEIKIARAMGADVIGKTLVPETILARRRGMRVGAVVIATSFGAGFLQGNPTHAQIREMARAGSVPLKRLLKSFFKMRGEEVDYMRDPRP